MSDALVEAWRKIARKKEQALQDYPYHRYLEGLIEQLERKLDEARKEAERLREDDPSLYPFPWEPEWEANDD